MIPIWNYLPDKFADLKQILIYTERGLVEQTEEKLEEDVVVINFL